MRILHRYLGYFLVGIMTMYSISGMIMTFRDTDFLKFEKSYERTVKSNLASAELGKAIELKNLKITGEDETTISFEQGEYNKASGIAKYKLKEWPTFVKKLTNLHKSRSGDPLFFLNLLFGLSLFFFVVSSFWMFPAKTKTYKKGMLFVAAGIVLTVILVMLKK